MRRRCGHGATVWPPAPSAIRSPPPNLKRDSPSLGSRETTDCGGGTARTVPLVTDDLWQASSVRAERADRDQTTVVIADDHTVVRQGLRMLIDNEDGLQVIAEAGTVPDAERMTRAHRPTVLVLDLNMPGGSSLEAIPRLREDAQDTAIVVLTMQDDPAFARQALQAGALGFVLKEAADEELLEAIRLAANGDTYLNPRLGARLATAPLEPPARPTT